MRSGNLKKIRVSMVSIAILAAIVFLAFMLITVFTYFALISVKHSSNYMMLTEEYRQKVLTTTEAFFIVNTVNNYLNMTVKAPYKFDIALYVFIYKDLSGLKVRIVKCSTSCTIYPGVKYYIVYPPADIIADNIVGLKMVTDSGVVIPVPRRF